MNDISKHLFDAHAELKRVYEYVNTGDLDVALNHAEEALFHTRCAVLWLKEKKDATKDNI